MIFIHSAEEFNKSETQYRLNHIILCEKDDSQSKNPVQVCMINSC
jgi:hypothetical protein